MELQITLNNAHDEISDDRQVARLNFVGVNGDVAKVDLSLDNLRALHLYLQTVIDKHVALGHLAPLPEEGSPTIN